MGVLGTFQPTPGWEDLFAQRKIDQGHFYASKDNLYPTKSEHNNHTRLIGLSVSRTHNFGRSDLSIQI